MSFYSRFLKTITPKTGRMIRENGSITNVADLAQRLDLSIDAFSQMQVPEYSPIIELKSVYGISDLRDKVVTEGGGSVINTLGEFICEGSGEGDIAQIGSAERGRYLAGLVGLPGLGVRVIDEPTGPNDDIRWGYFDDAGGFGFGQDENGVYTFLRDDGSDIVFRRQQDWVLDRLDGTGPSGLTLDPSRGVVYRMPFVWYGYGSIIYSVLIATPTGDRLVYCDAQRAESGLSVSNANLPIRLRVEGDCSAAVAGRQYGIYGRYEPNRRIVSDFSNVVTVSTTFLPLISFRLRDDTDFRSVSVKVAGVDVIATNDVIWQLRINTSLTGASWGLPRSVADEETATEYDISATEMTGGLKIFEATSLGGRGNQSGSTRADVPNLDVPTNGQVTLCARSFSGDSDVKSVLRDRQEW